MTQRLKIVAFDADDTLWDNEPYFKQAERRFTSLLASHGTPSEIAGELFRTEMENLDRFGFGAKSFTISMIETALRISGNQIGGEVVAQLVALGKSLLELPATPYPKVEEVLCRLRDEGRVRLVVATKGDPTDQRRKLERSGLSGYFSHAEIMPDKTESEYLRLGAALGVAPSELLMVGNSLRSDIQPVLSIGGHAVYIPSKENWQHEVIEPFTHERMRQIGCIAELPALLESLY